MHKLCCTQCAFLVVSKHAVSCWPTQISRPSVGADVLGSPSYDPDDFVELSEKNREDLS